jgi:outer membrane receptor protein involved in Fe transport
VISADQIAQQQPFTLMAVMRQAVPTSVAFDPPNGTPTSSISVRGASSLNGSGDMKIFIDGIEASSFGQSPIDVTSIDRVEVIRGPEAATIYGADAASGVIQVFTKRGDVTLKRPQLDARVSLGISQTPYAGARDVARQRYSVALRGGGEDAGYNVGGGYTRLANYAPNNGTTRQSVPSIYGGMNLARGIMTVDVSARHLESNIPDAFNPLLSETGFAAGVPPQSLSKFTNETAGGRLTAMPTGWWRNKLTVGVDGFGFRNLQTTPRRTSASDTLLYVSDRHARKFSMSLNTTFSGYVRPGLHGSITLGIDHYTLDVASVSTSRALNTSGTIQTVPAGAFNQSLTSIRNTGYFTQLQASVRDAVFLTVGLRAENNTTFGTDYGTAILPRVGLSLVRAVGAATLKIRGSYGEAFRAPRSGQAAGLTTTSALQLENPALRPEKQRGWDGGVDLNFGSRASLGVSVFNQTARDLISFLQVATEPMTTYQYRNIGRVSNKGLELEGSARVTPWLRARAQYGYVRSHVEETGAAGGLVQAGDVPVNVPTHTAGLAITATPFDNSSLSAGVTYVGSWYETDVLSEFRCLATLSEEACPAEFLSSYSTRVFRVPYPAFAKVNATITHRFTPQFEAYLSVDNLANNESYEFSNALPVMGRTTMVGLHFTY